MLLYSRWEHHSVFESLGFEHQELEKEKKDHEKIKEKFQEDVVMNPESLQKEDNFESKPINLNSTYQKSESNMSVIEKCGRFDKCAQNVEDKSQIAPQVKFNISETKKSNPKPHKTSSRSLMTPRLSKDDVTKLCEELNSEINRTRKLTDSIKNDEEDKDDSNSSILSTSRNRESINANLFPAPIKAIEASIKSRKTKNNKSEFCSRRDVVHKAIFRAMRRYYFALFEDMHSENPATKENFKELVKEFIRNSIIDFDSLPVYENPADGISQEGMLMVMMTIISQQLSKSWCYKMKNQSFNKYFVNIMNKYSFSVCIKLFDNLNFTFVVSKFLNGNGFDEAKQSMQTFQENSDAYDEAAKFFKDLCSKQSFAFK